MESIVLLSGDASKEINKKAGSKLKLGKMPFRIEFLVDKDAVDELDKSGRFVSRLSDGTTTRYNLYTGEVARYLKAYSAIAERRRPSDSEFLAFEYECEQAAEELYKDVTKIAEKQFKAWQKIQSDRKAFKQEMKIAKIASGLAIVGGVVSLAAGVATGGLSIAMTSVSLAKAVVRLSRDLKRNYASVDKSRVKLAKTLIEVQAAYKKNGKRMVGAKESAKKLMDTFVATEVASIDRAKKDLRTYRAKLSDTYATCDDLGRQLHGLLDASSGMQRSQKKLEDLHKAGGAQSKKTVALLKKNIDKNAKSVQGLIKSIEDMDKTLGKEEEFTAWADKTMDGLNKKNHSWTKGIGFAIVAADIATPMAINAIVTGGKNLEGASNGAIEALSLLRA